MDLLQRAHDARIWLSALPDGSEAGSAPENAVSGKTIAERFVLPSASSAMPSSIGALLAATSASRERLTWRALRATSLMPFL